MGRDPRSRPTVFHGRIARTGISQLGHRSDLPRRRSSPMLARAADRRRHMQSRFPQRIRKTKRGVYMSHHALLRSKGWSTPLFMCHVLARRLFLLLAEAETRQRKGNVLGVWSKLTSLPEATHLRQGRSGSHPRCLCLQFTHAEGTWALALRVVLGVMELDSGANGR